MFICSHNKQVCFVNERLEISSKFPKNSSSWGGLFPELKNEKFGKVGQISLWFIHSHNKQVCFVHERLEIFSKFPKNLCSYIKQFDKLFCVRLEKGRT